MKFLIRILVTGLAVFISTLILPGVHIDVGAIGNRDFLILGTIVSQKMLIAVLVAAVLALLNASVKPLLIILTIPITVFTLGFFLLVINAFMIILASKIVPGFRVDGFWYALLFSIVLSIINAIFESSNPDRRREE